MDIYSYLQHHQIILLFLIITLGFIFGQIKIFGFSFESSGILFVAMLFGNYGFTLNHDFQVLGLILFIYAIGLQAGPTIFNMSRSQSLRFNSLVLLLLGSGAALTFVLSYLGHIDMALAIGLFAGAMTSTPGLAAAQEATGSALTSTGYGVAYPFGVIGVILFIKLMPTLFRTSIKKEEEQVQKQEQAQREPVISKLVRITNKELDGRRLDELDLPRVTGIIISRVIHEGELVIPKSDTVLRLNDIVRIVGEESKIKKALPFLGRESKEKLPESRYFESRKFVVTNKQVVGKLVSELNLHALFNANITRIRRGGLEFTAEPDQRLCWGDRVRVAGDATHMDEIRKLFGDEMKKLEYGDIFSIILGVLLGVLVGLIPFSIGKVISFNLGITGGVLLAGLFLSNRGKVGPVVWFVPAPIINFMREFGLTLFLAVVGIRAGSQVLETLRGHGLTLVLFGALITLLPMIGVALFARLKYKLSLLELFGLISGGMTSTPGLAAGTAMTESQRPLILYASVYPFAMLLMMIFSRLLALFT